MRIPPPPGSFEHFSEAVEIGGSQAYSEYRGAADIRMKLAEHLADFTGAAVQTDLGILIAPGTQGALFLAVASTVGSGDKVAIVQPDYFANRKLVEFFGGQIVPVALDYLGTEKNTGLDMAQLRGAFEAGAKTFLFSNPNNPTGSVYSAGEIAQIAALAAEFGVTVIADQLYSRLRYGNKEFTHIRAAGLPEEQIVTIIGPSKTESLSGYWLGVAFGSAPIIERMEKLQAIVSLRAAGYNQAVLRTWFDEPNGWLEERIVKHQTIRDDLVAIFRAAGMPTRLPQAGSYLFPTLAVRLDEPRQLGHLLGDLGLRNEGAFAAPDFDQSAHHQVFNRLANRRAADAKSFNQAVLRRKLAARRENRR